MAQRLISSLFFFLPTLAFVVLRKSCLCYKIQLARNDTVLSALSVQPKQSCLYPSPNAPVGRQQTQGNNRLSGFSIVCFFFYKKERKKKTPQSVCCTSNAIRSNSGHLGKRKKKLLNQTSIFSYCRDQVPHDIKTRAGRGHRFVVIDWV